ncbi:MAG: FTR1 family protein [Candidatus Bathyarchaeia archaeon]
MIPRVFHRIASIPPTIPRSKPMQLTMLTTENIMINAPNNSVVSDLYRVRWRPQLLLYYWRFIVVFREGFETVLFLTPFFLTETTTTIVGALAGMITALILSLGIYIFGMKINIRRFFYFTSILLVLIAGGLAGYWVHELAEYYKEVGVDLGWLFEKAYVLNISADNFYITGI